MCGHTILQLTTEKFTGCSTLLLHLLPSVSYQLLEASLQRHTKNTNALCCCPVQLRCGMTQHLALLACLGSQQADLLEPI